MKKIPVWIDTDCGVDDAAALLVGCQLPELEICGVSAVAGNTTLANAFRNARNVLNLAKRSDIKVYKGADKPLIRQLRTADSVHGTNGLGGALIEDSEAPIETANAADALYACAKEHSKQLVLITIGPLTNIAIAIAKHPDIVDHIKMINIMGGAIDGGNITPCAEFNIYEDPEAAENVFKSQIPVNMFGLDVTEKAFLTDAEIKEIISYGNKASALFRDSMGPVRVRQNELKNAGLCEHDCCPVIYTAHPDFFSGRNCGIFVETQGMISSGKTVSDLYTDFKYEDRHCQAFIDVDRQCFAKLIKDCFKAYGEDE